ncbi:formylglycine-generating enzyme family protein, partial [Vibrio breoganii]
VMGSSLSYFQNPQVPVNNLSWQQANYFVEQLNELTGEEYRLPTEAEWEFAAKGGNKSKGYTYSGSNNLDDV